MSKNFGDHTLVVVLVQQFCIISVHGQIKMEYIHKECQCFLHGDCESRHAARARGTQPGAWSVCMYL